MGRFNNGTVYSTEKCVGCNRCKSVCPSLGASVTVKSSGKTSVAVSNRCVECGLCVSACRHHAREYRDDFDSLIADLKAGKKISLLVDPAFYIDYGDDAYNILGTFKELGINKIYDVSVGGEISVFAHAKYVKENTKEGGQARAFIANSCAALVTFVEKLHPNFLQLLIPVHSPVVCTAIYVREYLHDDSELALLSPCLSQNSEIHIYDDNGSKNIRYNATFTNLSKYIRKEGFSDNRAVADYSSVGLGNLLAHKDGFIDAVSLFFDRGEVFTNYSGLNEQITQVLNAIALSEEVPHSVIATINACTNGCVEGNGVRRRDTRGLTLIDEYKKIRKAAFASFEGCVLPEDFYNFEAEKYKDIDLSKFARTYNDKYRQLYQVPEDAVDDIFLSMHKDNEEKRNVNCQSCGYTSCREMAVAVACGYARIQDCVHFMNDDLQFAALTDRLSGIPNQAGFMKYSGQILKENPDKDFLIFVGNVNRLKHVNNLYGFDAGDKLLDYVARRLKEITEGHGTCGRLSGGMFGVLVEDKPEYVEAFTQFETVDAKHLGIYFPITVRYGMLRIQNGGMKLGRAINYCTYAADKATDRTKNTYIEFNDSMYNELQLETDITLKMRSAMDAGEFVLYLQPQYNHETGEIVGAETLSRWIKEDGTMVSPGLFIPVFEKNGFIKVLDKYVWENAFRLVRAWEISGMPMVPISVNISRVSMETDAVIDVINQLSIKYPINKNMLHFEITESAYSTDQAKMIERVSKIRELGFKIAMDDFGSGYSSLNSLKDIPLDILKLDMGFLRNEKNIERGNEIVAYVLSMAKQLGFSTVGEGVETKQQADYLTEKGCDVIQGFYYARPMPLTEFEEQMSKTT